MILVLDASAAIATLSSGATILEDSDAVYVPDLFVAEVTNIVWKQHRFGQLDLEACETTLDQLLRMPDVVVPSGTIFRAAFHLARTSGHSAYDMFYIALARREDATLFTKDKALRKLAQQYKIDVV
ncbi:MAG: type II toxin-antitoxin system VapC family toxin [Bryobacteraceae bacterium]